MLLSEGAYLLARDMEEANKGQPCGDLQFKQSGEGRASFVLHEVLMDFISVYKIPATSHY